MPWPWGAGDFKSAVRTLLQNGGTLTRVPEGPKVLVEKEPDLAIAWDRDNSDYLYSLRELVELKGRHFDGKRNQIRKFKSSQKYDYLPLEPELARACLDIEAFWCLEKDCEHVAALDHERLAIRELVEHYGEFRLLGGAIRLQDRLAAFALGEALNPETLVIHFLKALPGVPGLYQIMLNEFLSRAGAGFKFVNLEQDLGVPGLRQSKESYHPLRLVNAYTLGPLSLHGNA